MPQDMDLKSMGTTFLRHTDLQLQYMRKVLLGEEERFNAFSKIILCAVLNDGVKLTTGSFSSRKTVLVAGWHKVRLTFKASVYKASAQASTLLKLSNYV